MSKPNKISDYIKTVCEQIRWKKAHAAVSKELEDHIIDQKSAYQNEGIDEDKATDEAIRQMGDPVVVGTQLDGTYRPKPDWVIIIFTIVTLFLGVTLNILMYNSIYYQRSYLSDAITPAVIGIIFFSIAYLIDFTIIGKYAKFILIQFFVIAFASRFSLISYGTLNFIMLLFPIIYAGIIYQQRNKGYLSLFMCVLLIFIPAYISWVSLSTFAMLIAMCVLILTFAVFMNWFKIKKLYGLLIIYAIPLALTAFFLYKNYSYIISEMTDNYTLNQVRKLLHMSRLFGSGTHPYSVSLNTYIKSNYLIACFIYKFGWISFIAIMTLLSTLIIKGFIQCKKQSSMLGKLVSYSVLVTITTQIVFTVIANMGILPTLASTMPLISQHSYSIVINMFLIGIMLSAFKTGNLITDSQTQNISYEERKSVELLKGKLVINIRR